MRIISTRSQYPLTTVNIQVATPMTMRLPGHVRGPPAHPALGPVAQPPGHRIGEPADQPVGGQGEGDGQRARGPLLDEEGDQHARHGQVGPGADQSDGQPDEAADPGAVDARRGPARSPVAGGPAVRPSGHRASGRPGRRVRQLPSMPPLTRGRSFVSLRSAGAGSGIAGRLLR